MASPKPLSDTNQPIDLIGLPTTGSITLTPPAWEKLVGWGGVKVRHWNRCGRVLPTPGGGLGCPHWVSCRFHFFMFFILSPFLIYFFFSSSLVCLLLNTTVSVIASDLPFKGVNVRFTTVSFNIIFLWKEYLGFISTNRKNT